jgi:hypothetical protein
LFPSEPEQLRLFPYFQRIQLHHCIIAGMFRKRRITPSVGPNRAIFEEQVAQAQVLFQQKRFNTAAEIFEQLANQAEARGGPRAPRFFMQAGRSWYHAGNNLKGMQLLDRGWNLAIRTSRQNLLARIGPVLVAEMNELGFDQDARTISIWLTKIPALPEIPHSDQPKHLQLPLKCPSCGAPVIPTRVVWLDDQTAECDFCGSAMRGTSNPSS